MADFFGNLGTNVVTGALNSLFGIFGAEHNARINYKYNEMAAEAADKRQRALYNDYMAPASRIQQLKKAGLSPSLYADGAGAGSMGMQQGAQGAGASGVGLPSRMMDMQSLAEVKLMNAQADKAQTEADTLKGETAQGEANVAETMSRAGLNDAAKMYTKAQTTMQQINNRIASSTEKFVISRIESESKTAAENATKAFWDAEDAGLNWQFNVQTFEKRAETIANQAAELAARTAMEYSQQKLNNVEMAAIKDYVIQGYMDAIAHVTNAVEYGRYVEAYTANLPKQLELRGKELNVEKWRIGVNAFTELIRSAAYVFGAEAMAGETTGSMEEVMEEYDQYGYPHPKGHKTKTYTGKRGFGGKW